MTDATNGPGQVESLTEAAVEDTLGNLFGDPSDAPQKKAPEVPEQEAEADQQADGLTPDDVPDEEGDTQAPVTDAEFEIVHNGQQHKLSRADTIKLAQQGFDYTQKTQALAERARTAEAVLERAAQIEQLIPHVAQDLAQVKAIEAQLAQYNKVDWVALATNDPLEYPKYRAQYDQLVNVYQVATQNYQQKANAVIAERQNLTAYTLQQEAQALRERIPEWRDPAKYQQGAQELRGYLIQQGADPAEVDTLSSSLAVSIARKAMLYDKLVSQKSAKSKQLREAAPVVRPGARPLSGQGQANFAKAQAAIRQAGRKGNHNAQEKLMEGLLGKAFPK